MSWLLRVTSEPASLIGFEVVMNFGLREPIDIVCKWLDFDIIIVIVFIFLAWAGSQIYDEW